MRGAKGGPLFKSPLKSALDTKGVVMRLAPLKFGKRDSKIPLQSIYPSRLSSSFHPFSLVPGRSIAFSFALTAMSASIKAPPSFLHPLHAPRVSSSSPTSSRKAAVIPKSSLSKKLHRQPPRQGLTARKGHPRRGIASHWLLHHE